MHRVLMTGAAGGVGAMLRPLLREAYPGLVLSDQREPPALLPGEAFRPADLADLAEVEAAVEGMEGILHLGGFSVEGPWETILRANIVGCYNLFEAARRQGVKRVVFASSNHVMGFHRRRDRVGNAVVPRPDSRYGVSKLFGEGLGALYADKHGLRVLSIRIGNVGDRPIDLRRLAIWLHPEDLVQLVRIGFEHPDLGYEVVYGASANERAWWDNSRAHELGYRPKHRAEDHVAFALAEQAKLPPDPIGDLFQGGGFCSDEYTAPRR
ncbi:MAG: NAD(P)-dependent oxidoreductase [Alphaproteobacteria bacterium]|nr:NAD(P)-dependent oxidoreductase [Alphaproteobacteria bacterium]